jgi:hypothetical protein
MYIIEYYENIAAEICELSDAKDIWKKTRKTEICKARQFCMIYRKTNLSKSYAVAGYRYNKDHATAMHAEKAINNLIYTEDNWGKKYLEFLGKCLEYEKIINEPIIKLSNRIAEIGWNTYVDEVKEKTNYFLKLIDMDASEDDVKKSINECIEKLTELKTMYE